MKKSLLLCALMMTGTIQAQDFRFVQEWDSVKIDIGGRTLPAAWRGGYNMSSPALVDIDGDGDFDILMGENGWGQMDYWQNSGTAQQGNYHFNLTGLQSINDATVTSPEFIDIDADGDLDLILGAEIGGGSRMLVYTNVGSQTLPYFQISEDTLRDTQGNMIYGTRHDLVDLDADGDYDLFAGEWYTGRIHFYRNIGSPTNYAFQLEDSYFAGVQTGYWSSPEFCDIDEDGDLDFFIGDDSGGRIWYYRNDGNAQQWNFTYVTNNWLEIYVGDKADPQFCDIDGDGDYDLFLGKDNDNSITPPGDIHFWRNLGTPQAPQLEQENQMYLTFDLGGDARNIKFSYIANSSVIDAYLFYYYLGWMRNIGTLTSPRFQMMNYSLLDHPYSSIVGGAGFGDLNSDGHNDLVITHGWSGVLDFWLSNGDTTNPGFNFIGNDDWGELHSSPVFGDLDGDGDTDMLIVGGDLINDGLRYFQNQGDPQHFNFVCIDSNYQNSGASTPVLVDFDGDGDLDLLTGRSYPDLRIKYYQNQGTPQQANMVLITEDLFGIPCPTYDMPDFFDIDGDGDMDAIGGTMAGGLLFFRNITGDSTAVPIPPNQRPRPSRVTLTIGPNPSNPITAISYQLSVASLVNLSVYDISGRRVAQLVNGRQNPGDYSVSWNATSNASGVYLVRLTTPGEEVTQKVVVVK
ncbi:MAG: FG-GAP-like repeat-containing protein [bacterium]|nr:FG-GAP-like repeat-containing protein [bacterium]